MKDFFVLSILLRLFSNFYIQRIITMDKSFDYKELDIEGLDTLDSVAQANRFNKWMYKTIQPYTKGRILEIGSGIGNISQFFIEDKQNIVLSDIRENYRSMLRNKFSSTEVADLDIVDPKFDSIHTAKFGTYDSIFALNVVEHIQDDKKALENCYKLLKPGGNLIILVPAYQTLYNNFDKALEHYRRYTVSKLSDTFPDKFQLIHKQYFNAAGILGWFVTGNLMGKEIIPGGQMKLYNLLVPIFKIVDKVLFNKVGLSAVVVGKK